jgi:uncharacterized protein YhaN
MPVHIEDINARGLGPLDEFTAKLRKINLIYGRNEQGKTFLVEFLLKSLFKNTKGFGLRALSPTGTIHVSGLGPEPCAFSPSSHRKLEDYWEENFQGMPTNVAQLLVVKGAELDFDESSSGGVSKSIIKSFLSSERTLDTIEEKIQTTVRDAYIEDGEIIGAYRGELKTRNNILDKLSQIESLLNKVDQEYSGGTLTALRARENVLQENISNQIDAKRHLAYVRSENVEGIAREIQRVEEAEFSKLVEDHTELLRKEGELEIKVDGLGKKVEKTKHFEWLSSAIGDYESYLRQGASPAKRLHLILAAVFSFSAILLASIGFLLYLFDAPVVDAVLYIVLGILIALSTISGFMYFRQQKKNERVLALSNELKRIESSYKDKFDEPLTDIATLKSKHQSMQADYYAAQTMDQDSIELKSDIKLLKTKIQNGFKRLNLSGEDESLWSDQIAQLKRSHTEKERKLQRLQLELANLGIDRDEYLEVDPEIIFDKAILARYESAEIRAAISDKTSISWDDLLENLRQKYRQLMKEYRGVTSKILAGIIVTHVIKDARQKEDEKIKAVLQSPVVQSPLYAITKKYNKATITGEILRVSDKFEEFDIAELSTGAREQVLLALRIGFAAKIMGTETAFLILDDAFQHSDWIRRQYSIDSIITLAKNGWQIIYLSMDDHIRELFNNVVKREFESDYSYYEL